MTSNEVTPGKGGSESTGVSVWQLTVVGIRLMALWIFCSALDAVPVAGYSVMSMLAVRGGIPGTALATHLAPALIMAAIRLGLGVFLFMVAPPAARMICREWGSDSASIQGVTLGVGDLYRIASYLLGIYVLLRAVAPAAQAAARMTTVGGVTAFDVASLVEAIVLIICGAVLVFGARSLSHLLASVSYDSEKTPAQNFSLRMLLIVFVGCAILLALIRALVR